MKLKTFQQLVANRQAKCNEVLNKKKENYATGEDRLEQFKDANHLTHSTPEQALWGMASKHITAISYLIREGKFGKEDLAQWEEKLTDTINYLYLLEGLVKERSN